MNPESPLAALYHTALRGLDGIGRGTAVIPRYARGYSPAPVDRICAAIRHLGAEHLEALAQLCEGLVAVEAGPGARPIRGRPLSREELGGWLAAAIAARSQAWREAGAAESVVARWEKLDAEFIGPVVRRATRASLLDAAQRCRGINAAKAPRYTSVPRAARPAGARFELVLAAIYELAAETEP